MAEQIRQDMHRLESVDIVNKKIYIFLLVLSLFVLTSCSKRNDFFTDSELENFGLNNLIAPDNSSNYYNKSSKNTLFCYMNVSKDDDVRNFVLNILDMLEKNEIYKEYGYAKDDDMYNRKRKIYLSNDINNYQINTNNHSKDSVTFNAYEFFYSLCDESNKNTMFVLNITSYTEENTNYLSGYNLIVSVVKKNYSNYTIITE